MKTRPRFKISRNGCILLMLGGLLAAALACSQVRVVRDAEVPVTPTPIPVGAVPTPAQIQCFAESDVHPNSGDVITSEDVTFSWPAANSLPEGYAYRLNLYGAGDNYTALVNFAVTRATSTRVAIPLDRAGDIVWYLALQDAQGNWVSHGECSSFQASLLSVDPPTGIKGVHFTYAPQAAAGGGLPDLMINWTDRVMDTQWAPGGCVLEYAPYVLRVYVKNVGAAAAGAFAVEVNGVQKQVAGLAAGEGVSLDFPDPKQNDPLGAVLAVVDPAQAVAEITKDNNRGSMTFMESTPPPRCTPTPMP